MEHIERKYKDILKNFEYVPLNKVSYLKINDYIIYFNKSHIKKSGTIMEIKDKNILQLCSKNKVIKWCIYVNEVIIYVKKRTNNSFRNMLIDFLENDFQELTYKSTKNKKKEETIQYCKESYNNLYGIKD